MPRERVAPISPYESMGYSRALRVGNLVFVAGTAAIDAEGKNVAVGDAYGQAKRCFEVIEASLQQVGAAMSDVVRTRIFLANIDDLREVGRAHAEVFAEVLPASTGLEVAKLGSPDWLVEIEADAVIES